MLASVELAADPFSDRRSRRFRACERWRGGRPAVARAGRRPAGGDLRRARGPRADAALIAPLTLTARPAHRHGAGPGRGRAAVPRGTVVLSYAFALGASAFVFTHLLGQPDSDPGLPLFAFIFLVALGVDYNIFLISRVREELPGRTTPEAVAAGPARAPEA